MNENISKALVAAQAEMPPVPMNASNPYFKSRYADLGSVIDTVRPILKKYGLAVSQLAIGSGGEVGVKTILLHESGEFLESSIMVPIGESKSNAQAAGAIITYLRRYSLSSILGIYADEDTDGNQPAPQAAQKKAPAKKATSTGNIFDTVTTREGVLYSELDIPALASHVNGIIDHIKKHPELTEEQRSEYELKRDAAEYFIKMKKEQG